MKKIRTSIIKNKYLNIFLISLIFIGIIFGIIIFYKQTDGIKNVIGEKIGAISLENYSFFTNFLFSSIIILIIAFFGITIIGDIGIIIYIFYESVSLGFLLISLINSSNFNGFIFFTIYLLLFKIIYYIIIWYITINSIIISKNILFIILNKNNENKEKIESKYKVYIFRIFVILTINFINNILIYYISTKILKIFLFLL